MRDEQERKGGPARAALAALAQANGLATLGLRVLSTTDIHMQLLGFDYARDKRLSHAGMAGLATLVREARAEAARARMGCLLVDNGDLLQGAPIDHWMRSAPVNGIHPVIACLKHMQYDACGLGNHDLDHGIDYLEDIARHLSAPMISSNLVLEASTPLVRSAMVTRNGLTDSRGTAHDLRIGLVSALPEKTALWNARELAGRGQITPILPSLTAAIQTLRAQGADLVLLLAHLGLEGADTPLGGSDDARTLADLPGVDAIVMGHTHRRLPGRDHAGYDLVDGVNGMMGDRPSVMAGFDASDLAVLDLRLCKPEGSAWQVLAHETELRRNTPDLPADQKVSRLFAPAHHATRQGLSQRCGETDRCLHNFFSLAAPTRTCALVASAKHLAIRAGLAGTPDAALPILASASAHTAGGRGGPGHFLHMHPGPILARHLAGLSPYANDIWALRVSGAELAQWLEHAAGVYTRLQVDQPNQPLRQEARPIFDFDTIYGLSYTIDPTQPEGARIGALLHEGTPVRPDQTFIMATSNFRATGGGGGQRFAEDQIALRSPMSLTQALTETLAAPGLRFALDDAPWRFATSQTAHAILRTAPEALGHLDEIADLHPHVDGMDAKGFARLHLTL